MVGTIGRNIFTLKDTHIGAHVVGLAVAVGSSSRQIAQRRKSPEVRDTVQFHIQALEPERNWPWGEDMNRRRLKEKRDRALLAVLPACGLRRHEAVELNFGHIQRREEHWAIVDMNGKAGHTRTIPMPGWVKNVVDQRIQAANITSGKLFRRVHKMGKTWGERLTEKAVWHVVREYATKAGIDKLSPHDLRSYAESSWSSWCANSAPNAHPSYSIRHNPGFGIAAVACGMSAEPVRNCATTEAVSLSRFNSYSVMHRSRRRYLGCKQNLGHPVNDLFDLRMDAQRQAKPDGSVPAKEASEAVEKAPEPGIECRHGGSEHERPICDSKHVSLPERTQLVEVGKGHRPQNLRRCCEAGTSGRHAESKGDGEPDQGTCGRVGIGTLLDPAS
jgi:hypothetical protein